MKKNYIIVALIFLLQTNLTAQLNYTVTYPTLTYTAVTGTNPTLTLAYPPAQAAIEGVPEYDEGAANNILLPFPFTFNCVKYVRCHISTNGFLALGTPIDTLNLYWNNDLKSGPFDTINNRGKFTRPLIAPLWDDLDMQAATNIVYNTTGTAPNRIFTVQWTNAKWNWLAAFASVSFQVKLYENDNSILFHYRALNGGTVTSSAGASVGLADCSLGFGNFLSISKLSNLATVSSSNSIDTIKVKPAANFAIKFTPQTCTEIYTSSPCHSSPLVIGEVFYDNNKNGIKDSTEMGCSNVKVKLSNGDYSFSNYNGSFILSADSLGTNVFETTAPNLYTAFPQNISYNFSTYDTIVKCSIALQTNVLKDSSKLIITPTVWRARPGFDYPYHISYQNIGTTTVSPVFNFNFDTTKLLYTNSSDTNVIKANNTLILNIGSLTPGQGGSFIAYFKVKPTVPIGDSIIVNGTLTYTKNVRIASIVGGSYDPNDKQATPVLTPTQVALGRDIDYTIRFQNTGNDTAFTVVIADTLSSSLQANTLSVLASSHNCKTTVNGNAVQFEFLNILLADSIVNEKASHGFVSFKVKPIATLSNGSSVNNMASIYFDYNKPVLTNTAITQINLSGVVTPLKFTNYSVKQNIEKSIENIWQTAIEINVSHFNVQRSYNGRDFVTIGKVDAKNSAENKYSFIDPLSINNLPSTIYYRLQSVDKDGKVSYSEIRTLNLKTQTSNIALFPNPAKDLVNISCFGMKEIRIINQLGQTIQQLNNTTEHQTINTKQFPKGIYIVQVTTDKGEIKNEKLVIE